VIITESLEPMIRINGYINMDC